MRTIEVFVPRVHRKPALVLLHYLYIVEESAHATGHTGAAIILWSYEVVPVREKDTIGGAHAHIIMTSL